MFPRSTERGSIEASAHGGTRFAVVGFHVRLSVAPLKLRQRRSTPRLRLGFHVRLSVAPLKLSDPRNLGRAKYKFPRSTERGSIEARRSLRRCATSDRS